MNTPNPGVRTNYPITMGPPPVQRGGNTPVVKPVKAPGTIDGWTPPSWFWFAISIATLIASQALVALHTIPQSTPVTVALAIMTAIVAVLYGIQAMQAQQQAHIERMERIRLGR